MRRNFIKIERHSPYLQLFVVLTALIAVLWGAIVFDLGRSREEQFSKSSGDLSNLTFAFAKEIESSIKMIDLTLLDLREHWVGDPEHFSTIVRDRQDNLEREIAFQIAVIDANGMLVFSSLEQPSAPVNLGDREHFRIHRLRGTDELFISKPLLGRVSGRWSIQFTRPVYGKGGKFSGVLVLSVSPDYFYRFYRSITLPQDSAISLMRENGEVLSRFPAPDLALGKNITRSPFLGSYSPPVGIFTKKSQVDGVERLYAWRKLDRNDLVVSVGYSLKAISAPYGQQRSRSMLTGAAGTLLLLFVGYLKLITLRQEEKADEELATNEERWRVTLQAVGDGVWDWNLDENRLALSNSWKAMLGYQPDEIGEDMDEWKKRVHPDDLPRALCDLEEHFRGKTSSFASEQRVCCKDGKWKWVLARGMVILRDRHGAPRRMVGTNTDISDRKQMEEALKSQATTDSLTGLNNRRQFLARLEGEIARAARYPDTDICVLMADLDHFKDVNDTYGHSAGDAALRHFAQLLGGTARQTDVVGRLGGEEFAVLLTETALSDAEQFASRLCARLRETPLHFGDNVVPMTVSIGVATLEGLDVSAEQALHRADMALYQAKAEGRDRVVTKRRMSPV